MKPSKRYFHEYSNGRKIMSLRPLVYIDPYIARFYKNAEKRGLLVRVAYKISRTIRNATFLPQLPATIRRPGRTNVHTIRRWRFAGGRF